jgi:hypothetical protein
MIMVLSCFDLASVITNHPLLALHLVFWINEKHDLVAKMEIYLHFGITAAGFSLVALLMNIERYLGAYYPIFHRKSVTMQSQIINNPRDINFTNFIDNNFYN